MRNDQAVLRAVPDMSERVPFNDLTVQWREIADDVRREFEDVFARSAFSSGPFVKTFENEVAAYLGTKHAIACNSGTSALHLAVLAADLGPGDDALAARMRSLLNHGQSERYVHQQIGYNYRMDGLQGVVLRHKLKHIDAWTARRKALARRYQAGLAGLPLDVPEVHHQDHVWHL